VSDPLHCSQLVRPEAAGRAGEGFAPVQVVRSFSLIPQKVMLGRDRRPVSRLLWLLMLLMLVLVGKECTCNPGKGDRAVWTGC
jgi:hypothetical protein